MNVVCKMLCSRQRSLILTLFILIYLPLAASADIMAVTLLGTGTPRPEVQRFGAGILIEVGRQKLLFDSGRGVVQRLVEIDIPLEDADKLFITHLHYDHLVGLPDLFLSGWQFGRLSPLRVWGPKNTAAHTQHIWAAYQADIDFRHRQFELDKMNASFETTEIREGTVYEHDGALVRAFAVDHGIVRPAFGYRIEYGGHVVVISGDTQYSEALIKNADNADLLIHEVADANASLRESKPSLRKVLAYHTDVPELIDILKKTRPRITLLTHVLGFGISPEEILLRIQSEYNGDVRLGNDLLAVDVGERIRVYQRPAY